MTSPVQLHLYPFVSNATAALLTMVRGRTETQRGGSVDSIKSAYHTRPIAFAKGFV
jgi:hypothetical protein